MKYNRILKGKTFLKIFEITIFAVFLLVSIAGAAPFAYIPGANNVSVIDLATNKVTDTMYLGSDSYPFCVTVSPDGRKVYATTWSDFYNNVSIIDTTTNKVTSTVKLGDSTSSSENPFGIAVSPDGKKVYAISRGLYPLDEGSISVIDTDTNTLVATVYAESFPYGVIVSPDGKNAYMTNQYEYNTSTESMDKGNTVSIIDTETNKITTRVKVGNEPEGIAVNPAGTKVYVTIIGIILSL